MNQPTTATTPAQIVMRSSMLYAFCMFAAGFVLGAMRVPFLAPLVGNLWAVVIEAPLMILVSWIIYKKLADLFRLKLSWPLAVLLGARALVYLQFFEIALFVFVFKKPLGEFTQAFKTPPGMVGLAAQVVCAFIPWAHFIKGRNNN